MVIPRLLGMSAPIPTHAWRTASDARPGAGRAARPWRCCIYLVGWSRLSHAPRTASGRARCSSLSGWTVLTLSLVSPLHEAGERSFTMHMIEHELIMLVATLLLAASDAGGVLAWGLPRPLRRRARRRLEIAAAVRVEASDRTGHRDRRPGRCDVGRGTRRRLVRPRARQPRLAHRPARCFFLSSLLSGGRCSTRAGAAAMASRRRACSSPR